MLGNKRWMGRVSHVRRSSARGQAVVEFALVMIFFLILMLAVLDLGRAFFTVVAIENAASEGALYGMANPNCVNQGSCGPTQDSIEYRVRHESENTLMDPDEVQFEVAFYPDTSPGSIIAVTVTYPFHPIIPLLSSMGADTIWLNRSAYQMVP